MSIYYAETSALLAWLLGEQAGVEILELLNSAQRVCTSRLTFIEATRCLVRAEANQQLSAADVNKLRGWLAVCEREWEVLEIYSEICDRAQQRFPHEPVRTLDAIHLASMLQFVGIYGKLEVLSLDERIIKNLEPLGLEIVR